MVKLNATHRLSSGLSANPLFLGSPCIEIAYTFSPTSIDGNGLTRLENLHTVWALLDTGADYNSIDEALVPPGLTAVEAVRSTGINGTHEALNYDVSLYMAAWSWTLKCGVITLPSRIDRPYSMILGRAFMQMIRFEYDGRFGLTAIEPISNPDAH